MSPVNTPDCIPSLILSASDQVEHTPPRWVPEIVLMAEVWKRTGLLRRFQQEVHVPRGRMGNYEDCDFALVDLAYVAGHEQSWRSFYGSMSDHNSVLAALWGRIALPLRSATSRFHNAIKEDSLEALRRLLFEDLLERGIPVQSFGGLISRSSNRFIMFDVDGTKKPARQRDLVSSPEYPPAQRRAGRLCKPGYTGRKRGEVVRTRTTVQQSHTQEWLGTFSAEGNGKPVQELRRACEACVSYLVHHQMPAESGILRLDGFYGWAGIIAEVHEFGLNYISRCSDYGLLNLLQIPEKLVEMEPCNLWLPDSGLTFQLYDYGWITWSAENGSCKPFPTHLLVSRRRASKGSKKHTVGKQVGSYIYELFVTSLKSSEFVAGDVVSVYYGRSGFETTFMHEDKEQQPDRTYSLNPAGQEWCQVLCQWIWNERLRQGFAAKGEPTRCTIWSEALPALESPLSPDNSTVSAPTQEQIVIQQANDEPVQTQHEESKDIQESESIPEQQTSTDESVQVMTPQNFSASNFIKLDKNTLLCPAGKELRLMSNHRELAGRKKVRYAAQASDCSRCEWVSLCRPNAVSTRKGRRVTLRVVDGEPQIPKPNQVTGGNSQDTSLPEPAKPRASPSPVPPQPVGTEPVLYNDLPASMLRRFLTTLLLSLRFDLVIGLLPELAPDTPTERLTRAQRAHRRLNYGQRLARNALPQTAVPGSIHIHGLPNKISEYLDSLGQNTRAP